MNNNQNVTRLYEISELSTENTKTYAMSDGSRQTVFTVAEEINENAGIMTLAATEAEPSNSMVTKSWQNSVFSDGAEHTVGITGTAGDLKVNRMYLSVNIPTLPRNPRIKNAELVLKQKSYAGTSIPAVGLYRIDGELTTGTADTNPLDYEVKKNNADAEYCFDITDLVDEAYRTGAAYANLAVRLIDEEITTVTNAVLYGASSSTDKPEIRITYESSYGVNNYYRTHSHDLGKFGEATVDLACGNLMFESTDFAWLGSRMPLTFKRSYNSALYDKQYTGSNADLNAADFSAMNLGLGWRLNLMQSMVSATVYYEGVLHNGYIYTDENGNETRFIPEKDGNGNDTDIFFSIDDEEKFETKKQQRRVKKWKTKKPSKRRRKIICNGKRIREKKEDLP